MQMPGLWHVCGMPQTCPQLPQLELSDDVFTSQPSIGMPLQSAYETLHEPIMHCELAHVELAFGSEHTLLQPPQFAGSLVRLASQPSPGMPLQSARPAAQMHMPPEHVVVV